MFLPNDITSYIIEQFCYLSTLQACSLVCRSFVVPSQKRLFHTIYLNDVRKAQEHCKRFHNTLIDNPGLSSHVRELYVQDYHRSDHQIRRPIDWASYDGGLHMILKMLHQLRLLSFQFYDANTRLPKWDRLSSELKLSLLRLFQSPNLEICHLRGIELPFNFFDSFRSVRKLSLFSISMETFPVLVSNGESVQDGPDPQQNPRPSQNVHLASLELWNCCMMPFKPIRASLNLSQLREVSIQSQSPDIVWEAIKDTTLLESLTWDIRHHHIISEQHEPFDPGNIDLSLFPTLRVLRISISSFCYERDPLPWLIRSLEDIELAAAGRDDVSKLEEITLHIGCHSSIIKVSVLSGHSIWTDLDKLLTTSPTFCHLRKFRIYVFHAFIPNVLFSGWDMAAIVPMMCSSLPSLRRRGILHIEPTTFTLKQIISADSSFGSMNQKPY